jgi:hypothetical protein
MMVRPDSKTDLRGEKTGLKFENNFFLLSHPHPIITRHVAMSSSLSRVRHPYIVGSYVRKIVGPFIIRTHTVSIKTSKYNPTESSDGANKSDKPHPEGKP